MLLGEIIIESDTVGNISIIFEMTKENIKYYIKVSSKKYFDSSGPLKYK